MVSREGDGASFDPKTWLSPGAASDDARSPAAGGSSSPDETSFDLRSWANPADATAPPPGEGSSPPSPPQPAKVHSAATGRSPWLMAIGSGVAILAMGAGISRLARETNAPVTAAATTSVTTTAPTGPVAAISSRRTLVVSGPGEVAGALRSSGIVPGDVTAASGQVLAVLGAAPGDIRMEFDLIGDDGNAKLLALEATRDDGAGLTLTRDLNGAFKAERAAAKLTTQIKVVRGEMDAESFYTSAVAAGVTDSLISDFGNAFSFDFDMQREVAPGDVFEAAFEQSYNPAGQPVGIPKLIYVSLTTATKSRQLYRFVPPGEKEAGWFDGNGHSTVRALMRTPIDAVRISSKFGMRDHPVLGYMKMHTGVDFAAPIGTPIYAAGNGVVEWAAMKGPNGNLTKIKHDNGWETLYLHQKFFMPGIVVGARVTQGQKIGEVGLTGRTTGPHLHYEVHINGQPVDPLGIDTGTGKSLDGAGLAAFEKERDRVDAARAKAAN
jgi:murein DD-endopeptidase MepM/ murein hydrolase activator NlpD